MVRWIATLLIAGCYAFQGWAQVAPAKSEQTAAPATMEKPVASSAPSQWPLDEFKEFSAVMVGSALPKDDREGHIYRSGDLLRTEGPLSRSYMITDLITSETHAISKTGCMRSSAPFFRAYPFFLPKPGRKIESTSAGKETVDGHKCQIVDVTVSGGGLAVSSIKLRFWKAEDLHGFPVKIDAQPGTGVHSVIQYKNVVLGPQDETMFIYPKDCQDFNQDKDDDDDAQPASKPAPPPVGEKPPADNPKQ